MQEKAQNSGFLDRWYRFLFRPDNLASQLRRVLVTVVLIVVVLLTIITVAFTTNTATLLINIGVGIGLLIVAIVTAIWMTRNITSPLAELVHATTQVAVGKLEFQVDTSRPGEIGELARAFNQMTGRLRHSIEALEARARERTETLEIESEISSRIITILDVGELLQYVVDQIQTQFQFYHTHIYLLDESSGNLVMAAGYGEVGRQLKARNYRLAIGTGVVGQVAANNQPFVSNNVASLPDFVYHLLLPDTQSELAVPLRKGNKVFGVLDLHCTRPDRFSPEGVNLMQSLANITAVALDNARLLEETKHALQQIERLNRRITRESWDKTAALVPATGYHFKQGATEPLTNDSRVWLDPMKQAVSTRQLVKQSTLDNGNQAKSELAIPLVLRDQVIGVLGVKRETATTWADEEVAAVEAVADQIARALENARLSQEQEKTIEQLKELDRLKSEFLTSMSHELRTPLNSIIGFADVLLQGIDGDLPELAMHDIQLIYNSGQHLLALINDVLDLSKIEAERMELLLEEVVLHEVVTDVLASTATLVQNKPVDLVSKVDQDLPLTMADKLRLNQILINLVSNAAKFTEEGTITITADLSEDDPSKMRVAVIDTGIGIALDKQPTVFDRFRQADSSTSRKYGGSGLGLAICKRLVEMHGGEIGLSSIENRGSEFYFTIPLA